MSVSPPLPGLKKNPTQNSPTSINISNIRSDLTIDIPDEPTESRESQTQTKKASKPPPIILYGIMAVSKPVHSDCYSYKIFTKDQLRVIAKTSEAYKDIIDLICKNGVIGHTFTQKEKRSCRIVIKNLHHTTPKDAIFDEIEKTGYTSIVRGEIVCAISRRNKKPLNIFFPNVELGPNNPHLNA